MNGIRQLSGLGQSLWLDSMSRELLTQGRLRKYIDELAITGLTSNPTIFDRAIRNSSAYDASIRGGWREGRSGEELFFQLALEDLTAAADMLRPIHERSEGVDGWVSLEVSPKLVDDAARTIAQAKALYRKAARPNVFIKIPGTHEGLRAIEESIFAGVPINVTLLFSREHYLAAVEAYLRGIERRIGVGLSPRVSSVASVFVSRWDQAVMGKVPLALENRLGISVAKRTYRAYREVLASDRWRRLASSGVQPQRLLWASTGTKDPRAPDLLYVTTLAAPDTINTMPEATLQALAAHGHIEALLPADGGDAEMVLGELAQAGVDDARLAEQLQTNGVRSFEASWEDVLRCLATETRAVQAAAREGMT